jgi:hypothetical protein
MTAPETPPPPTAPPRKGLGPVLMVLLVLVGIILLLPGLCSLGFMIILGGGGGPWPLLWLLTFAIAFGGVMLIRYGVKNR